MEYKRELLMEIREYTRIKLFTYSRIFIIPAMTQFAFVRQLFQYITRDCYPCAVLSWFKNLIWNKSHNNAANLHDNHQSHCRSSIKLPKQSPSRTQSSNYFLSIFFSFILLLFWHMSYEKCIIPYLIRYPYLCTKIHTNLIPSKN